MKYLTMSLVILAAILIVNNDCLYSDPAVNYLLLLSTDQPVTKLVSASSQNTPGNQDSKNPSISMDGRFVAFDSEATNLIAIDYSGFKDVFFRDTSLETTERVSRVSNLSGGNGDSEQPSVSYDGRYIAFASAATNLSSADANGDWWDVFVFDRKDSTTVLGSISTNSDGGNRASFSAFISPEGRFLAFQSYSYNLDTGFSDHNGSDIFVNEHVWPWTNLISRLSNGVQADKDCHSPSASQYALEVVFESESTSLVATGNNGMRHIYMKYRPNGPIIRVSVDSNGVSANNNCSQSYITTNGIYVVFGSIADNLTSGISGPPKMRIYLRDGLNKTTELVSVAADGTAANGRCDNPSVSDDGRYVTFSSEATNLHPKDTNVTSDIYVYDRTSHQITLISIGHDGSSSNGRSTNPIISRDGRYVAFESYATNLVSGVAIPGIYQVYIRGPLF